jgi:hypothetical protein
MLPHHPPINLAGHVTVINMIGDSNKRTDAKIAELNAKWNETSVRLDHFIFVLEKYISERQNATN